EDVRLRPDGAPARPDVLTVEDIWLRRRPRLAGPLGVEPAEDVGPGPGASLGPVAILPAEDVGAARDLARDRYRDGEEPEQPYDDERSHHVSSYNSPAARRSRATRSRSAAGRSTCTCGPKPRTKFASSSIPRTRMETSVVPSFRGRNRSSRPRRRARSS